MKRTMENSPITRTPIKGIYSTDKNEKSVAETRAFIKRLKHLYAIHLVALKIFKRNSSKNRSFFLSFKKQFQIDLCQLFFPPISIVNTMGLALTLLFRH